MRGKVKGEDEIFALFAPSAAQRKKSFWNSSETAGGTCGEAALLKAKPLNPKKDA